MGAYAHYYPDATKRKSRETEDGAKVPRDESNPH
jgi:hypothetical protein